MSAMQEPGDVGPRVEARPALPPRHRALEGEHVVLAPLQAARDAGELYDGSHGSDEIEQLWTYMHYGPFAGVAEMRAWLAEQEKSTDPLFLSVFDKARQRRVGMVSFLNVEPAMRRLEVGNIWYSPAAQRSKVNTESVYLMLAYSFEELGYRRVEWKCDALNERSRRAALRLGFELEGIFKQHMVVKGRNRDTSWYAMLDRDWPAIKKYMETWLFRNESGRLSLTRLNRALR